MTNKPKLILTICFSAFVIVAYSQNSSAKKEAENLLNELNSTYPGLSAAVGYGDEIIWKQAVGYADVSNKTATTVDHQFRYYSLSKSITGMALIKLIEEGKLAFEKPITDYINDLPATYEQVLVKYLINHTAGVRHYNSGEWMKISQDNCEVAKEASQTFINDPLQTTPGEVHDYSSFGYVLLSYLIEEISGQPYNTYVKETILEPLGIDGIYPDQSKSLTQEVEYYTKWNAKKGKGSLADEVNNSCKFGGGGFVGTAEAVVKLHLAVANQKLFNSDLLNTYYSQISNSNGEATNYAFGIGDNISTTSGRRYHSHTGSALGASAVLIIYEPNEEFSQPMVGVILGNIKDSEMNSHIGKLMGFFSDEIANK